MSNVDARTLRHEMYNDTVPDTDVSNDDGRFGLTVGMCNAIRCAVDDGMSYGDVCRLFSFVSSRGQVRYHSIGDCNHTGGVQPVRSERDVVTQEECRRLRREWSRVNQTYEGIATMFGLSKSSAWKHINEECQHE